VGPAINYISLYPTSPAVRSTQILINLLAAPPPPVAVPGGPS
jgi:hypothetical protein